MFIPSGWDNEKKFAILYENIQTCHPDDTYNNVILKPESRQQLQKDSEVVAEDDQLFLLKMQAQLNQNVPSAITSTPPLRTPIIQQSFDRKSLSNTSPLPGVQVMLIFFLNCFKTFVLWF